tara:strand:- start:275 stop:613 length:339 start_codon:yes stop_codon:yes gene_type:complete
MKCPKFSEHNQDGVEIIERDFFKDPFSESELISLIGEEDVKEVFSWNSPSFKKTGLSKQELTSEKLIRMMLDEPRLIRRPLLKIGTELIVGNDRMAIQKALNPDYCRGRNDC